MGKYTGIDGKEYTEDDLLLYCECGYEFVFFFVKGEEFPKEIECPICGKIYEAGYWVSVNKEEE